MERRNLPAAKVIEIRLEGSWLKVHDWPIDVDTFRYRLIEWGSLNYQQFEWREQADPYLILIAETMLHRTRAKQVEPVYSAFVRTYPSIQSVARATLEDLQDALRPLGLLWRVEKLHLLAQQIVRQHDGEIPDDFETLMALPGVSHYIANALLCFAWGRPAALVDTNTLRVTSRLFGFELTDSSRRRKDVHAAMASLVDSTNPKKFNYGLIDLAHQICLPGNPACSACPIRDVPCKYGTSDQSTI